MIDGLTKGLQGAVNTLYAVVFGRSGWGSTANPEPKPKRLSRQGETKGMAKADKDDEPWHGRKPYHEAFTFLGRNLAYGLAAGFALGFSILYFDFNNIGTMIWQSPDAWLWIFLLFFGLFITFGGLAMATAVFSLGEERD